MHSYLIATVSFLCILGGALGGLFMQGFLPPHHLSKESQESIKLGAGLIATMAALILGLLVSSSKGTYDRVNILINEAAANTISLNQTLKSFGPEADPLRQTLLERVTAIRDDIWPENNKAAKKSADALRKGSTILGMVKMIADLKSNDPGALQMQSNAIAIATELNKQRWQITIESTSKLPLTLIVIPIFWITFLTFVYGLFAPRNPTVAMVLFFCSLSIAGAIYLICEMSMPLDGSIKVPGQPFQTVIEILSK
jgi:hypothetical protein